MYDQILPIYHPTSVVFVDDQLSSLYTLNALLPPNLAFQCFQSQSLALQAINGVTPSQFSPFSAYPDSEHSLPARPAINVDLGSFAKILSNPNRFSEISAVIVDYNMPGMNGLELCQRIQNPSIRKIILTAAADEKLAVDAFNNGLIDGFIQKLDPDVLEKISVMLHTAGQRYFQQMNARAEVLRGIRLGFLHDFGFIELFRKICEERKIVEHYVTANPDGVLMVDADADMTLLAVFTEDELQSQYEIASDQNAPRPLLEALKSREFVFWYGVDGFYNPQCTNWKSHLYPAQRLLDHPGRFHAIINDPLLMPIGEIHPYNTYLKNAKKLSMANIAAQLTQNSSPSFGLS